MANVPVYFRFFIDDYLRDAEELSMMRHGAYLRLMLWYYGRAKPIPNDLLRIYQRVGARSGEEEGAVRWVLSEFFILADGMWRHKRIEAELMNWQHRSGAAKASVLAREEKRNKNNASNSSNDDRTFIERSSNQNQNQNQTKPKARSTPIGGAPSALPPWLPTEVWQRWGKHRGSKLTKQAVTLQLKKLDALRQLGHDPAALIDLAIESGWATFYAPRAGGGKEQRATANEVIWGKQNDDDDDAIDGTAERVKD